MSRLPASAHHTESFEPRGERETRLHGRWLLLARVIWVAVVVLALGLFVASITSSLGLSVDFVVIYQVALNTAFACFYIAVAGVLFWQKSDDRMALFASFTLVTFVITFSSILSSLPQVWQLPVQFVGFLGSVCFGLLFYLFPTGRFVPRWTRWVSFGVIVYWGVYYFFPSSSINHFARFPIVNILTFVGFITTIIVAQVYRYRRASSPLQRQQTKWVVFATSVALIGYTGVGLTYSIIASYVPPNLLSYLIVTTLSDCFILLIPLSLGFAIHRYRLWEIDIIINRTLVYSILTALLALVYFGSVIGLQFLLHGFTGGNQFAIVGSTLLIAALFQPLRHRIQNSIDRRFYRRKYDAARTLAAFSATLRDEVDLNQLREQLVAVVQETMQPTFVSLWLRPPEHDEKQWAPWRANPPGSSEGG